MKKITLLASAILFAIITSCGPTQNEAITYNDNITAIIDGLTIEHNLFLNQIDGHNIDSLKLSHKLFADKATKSLDDCKKIGPFGDKKEFIDVATDYFTTLYSIATVEGTKMVELMSKDSLQITQQDLDKITEIATKFDADYDLAYNKIQAAQMKFAKEWKFTLDVNKK
ncbi:MAG: hypothetical protein H0U95_01660 [Bacteroidetes bacterium]|nr:hypothetical protein [Bacteroidota bacterium]